MEKMKKCFIISPIGEEKSEIRKRADLILKYIIEPVISECGFKAIRADKIAKSGVITNQVIEHIIDDPLVIADLPVKIQMYFMNLLYVMRLENLWYKLFKKVRIYLLMFPR